MPTQTIEVLRIPGTLFPRGAFDENASYKYLNFVESGGSGYVCLQPCTGIPVTNTAYWFKFCFKGDKGDAFTYADLTAEQKAELVRDATAAAQAAASSAQSAADDAAAALQKFNTIKAAIDAIDPQSTEGSIQTLAAKQGLLEADLAALGPKIDQVYYKVNGEEELSEIAKGSRESFSVDYSNITLSDLELTSGSKYRFVVEFVGTANLSLRVRTTGSSTYTAIHTDTASFVYDWTATSNVDSILLVTTSVSGSCTLSIVVNALTIHESLVENSLDSDDATRALSAAKGKELAESLGKSAVVTKVDNYRIVAADSVIEAHTAQRMFYIKVSKGDRLTFSFNVTAEVCPFNRGYTEGVPTLNSEVLDATSTSVTINTPYMVTASRSGYLVFSGLKDKITSMSAQREPLMTRVTEMDTRYPISVVDLSEQDIVDVVTDNLINTQDDDYKIGRYISHDTTISTDFYDTTGFIPVIYGKTYYYQAFNNDLSLNNYGVRTFATFDIDKHIVGTLNSTKSITIDDPRIKYIRLSVFAQVSYHSLLPDVSPLAYKPYSYGHRIKQSLLPSHSGGAVIIRANGMYVKGDMSSGTTLSLPRNSVKNQKSLAFSGDIVTWSTNTKLSVGHGTNGYLASWVEVDDTNISAYRYTTSATLVKTVPHGLTLANNIQVKVWKENSVQTNIAVCSDGVSFSTTADIYGDNGIVWAKIENGSLSDCSLGWFCKALKCDNWIFGDSYFALNSDARWTYYLLTHGHTQNLLNAYSGEGSTTAIADLQNLLDIATPKRIVWCMGMNDRDGESAVNAKWESAYNTLVQLCEANGIELILSTIPNAYSTEPVDGNDGVASLHNFKNAIVKASNHRYIDFYAAVGADANGNWYSGMKNPNDVHPTVKGAKALYYRACADCPELMA